MESRLGEDCCLHSQDREIERPPSSAKCQSSNLPSFISNHSRLDALNTHKTPVRGDKGAPNVAGVEEACPF